MIPKAIIALKDEGDYHAIYCGSETNETAKNIITRLKSHFNSKDSAESLIMAGNLAGIDDEGYYQYKPINEEDSDHLCLSYLAIDDIVKDAKRSAIKHIYIFIEGQWLTLNY